MERSILNTTFKDRKINIWFRERRKVIDVKNNVRQMKWFWAGHINRLKAIDGHRVHKLETIYNVRPEKTTSETSQTMER